MDKYTLNNVIKCIYVDTKVSFLAVPSMANKVWEQTKASNGGLHSTVDSILASHPAAPGSILGIPKIFSEKILDVVEI